VDEETIEVLVFCFDIFLKNLYPIMYKKFFNLVHLLTWIDYLENTMPILEQSDHLQFYINYFALSFVLIQKKQKIKENPIAPRVFPS